MKRILTLILAFCLLLSCVPIANAAYFEDVTGILSQKYVDAINYVSDNGIMAGTSDTEFDPDGWTSRAMVVTILYGMSGDTGTYTDASVFTDVPSNSWYFNAVGWALHNGITSGVSSTSFAPKTTVTKQEFILFLYKFADYMGFDLTVDESISDAGDYSSVSQYARQAVSWAYSFGILTRAYTTSKINPQEQVSRKDCALFAARFRWNVEGINLSRDAFSFSNSRLVFHSDHYNISEEDWDMFEKLAVDGGCEQADIDDVRTREWGGSCYGMAVATCLDYYGKVDLNGNFCNGINTMYEIPSLSSANNIAHIWTLDYETAKLITEIESKINLYQNSWYIPNINTWASYIDADTGLDETVQRLRHGGIGVFCYTFPTQDGNTGGHAVVAYGKPETTAKGYRIHVYDNRKPNRQCWLEIDTTSPEWTGKMILPDGEEQLILCKFQTDFDIYGPLDIDGDYNLPDNGEPGITEDYTILQVWSDGDFSIVNDQGEIFSTDGIEPNSTPMNIYGQNLIPYGEDYPYVLLYLVDKGTEFVCLPEDGTSVYAFGAVSNDTTVLTTGDTISSGTMSVTIAENMN